MNYTQWVLVGLVLWFLYAVAGYLQLRFIRRKALENWNLDKMSPEDLALALTVWDHRAVYPIWMKLVVISNVLFWWFAIGSLKRNEITKEVALLIGICYMPEEYRPLPKPVLTPSAI